MSALYDSIGVRYSAHRTTDPSLAKRLHAELIGATRIVNIGAGSGSYEPDDVDLVAVEPSAAMIGQRAPDASPCEQASAEALPFPNNSFSHAMTVLSMHHWQDRPRAFAEINRVATDKFVAISWDPSAQPFWLTRDYFPEIHREDLALFPPLEELNDYFDHVTVTPLLIPENCEDGFLAAFWKRPYAYLDPGVRQSISSFAKMTEPPSGLLRLEEDLHSGRWEARNRDLLDMDELDAGYRLITANINKSG